MQHGKAPGAKSAPGADGATDGGCSNNRDLLVSQVRRIRYVRPDVAQVWADDGAMTMVVKARVREALRWI